MNYLVKNSSLGGDIHLPPSKSHTLRAILFASLARGISRIDQYLDSPDTEAMIQACEQLGAKIMRHSHHLIITGTAQHPRSPAKVVDAGNSGQVLRYLTAISALAEKKTVLTGDHSLQTNRPLQPLVTALTQLTARVQYLGKEGYAPIEIQGPLQPGSCQLSGEDSQPVSALLIALAFSKGPTQIIIQNPGEKPWVEVTLDWLRRLGIPYQRQGYTQYQLFGNADYSGFNYTVPGDWSAAAFPLIGALITQSDITIHHADFQDIQGDKLIVSLLQDRGAQLTVNNENKTLQVHVSPSFQGGTIDVNDCIDAVPILTVLGCFAERETHLTNAAIARQKESDRLSAITQELRKMGAHIRELPDGLIIQPARLKGARVHSHQDHRIAMALSMAALSAEGTTCVQDVSCIHKSYPHFAPAFQALGASLEMEA